jgi:hypothetical protein
MTTPTPCGSMAFWMASAICVVRRSWIWRRRENSFDEARYFAQADDFAVGNVGDVHLAEEGQQVVLAEAEHFDVLDDDHLVVAETVKSAPLRKSASGSSV